MRKHLTLCAALLMAFGLLVGCGGKTEDTPGASGGDSGGTSAASGDKVIKFSAIPDQNNTELKEKFDKIAAYLTEKLGVKFEYVASKDYKASVEKFKNGDIHLAWFGGLTGVQARHAVEGARAIAMGKADPQYLSYFIAHKDAGLTKRDEFPQEIAKMSFTFGSESSTSGRLMPTFFIIEKTGKKPEEFFENKPTFSGSHDKTLELVRNGTAKVGVLSYKNYEKWVKKDPKVKEEAPVIWVTPPYADYNFTAHPDLDKLHGAGFIDKLQKALIEMNDPALLDAFPRKAMIEAKNSDFDGIVKVATDLGFLRK